MYMFVFLCLCMHVLVRLFASPFFTYLWLLAALSARLTETLYEFSHFFRVSH